MFPFKTESRLKCFRLPWLTWLIVFVNLVFFAIYNLQVIPDLNADNVIFRINDLGRGNYKTIFTSMFMHLDVYHILSNMYFFWIFGDRVERMVGHLKFALIYLVGGMIGALAFIVTSRMTNDYGTALLGASAAISAVMGAYLVLLPKDKIRMTLIFIFWWAWSAWLVILYYLANDLISMIRSNGEGVTVAYSSHVFSLLFGVWFSWILILMAGSKSKLFAKSALIYDPNPNFKKIFFRKKWNVILPRNLDELLEYMRKITPNVMLVDYRAMNLIGIELFDELASEKFNNILLVIVADRGPYKYWVEVKNGKQFQFVSRDNLSDDEIVEFVTKLSNGGQLKNEAPAILAGDYL